MDILDTRRRGAVHRGGVRLAYESAGAGDPAVLLLPAWTITDRRAWDAQTRLLPGRTRVVTYDGRGTGESDRPTEPAAYDPAELVADALAVLDATGTERAVLVGNSLGGLVGLLLAGSHPERVAGLVLIGASVDIDGVTPSALQRAAAGFDAPDPGPEAAGWARYNRHAIARDLPGFVRWFIDTALGPGGTPEDRAVGYAAGMAAGADVLVASVAARARRLRPDQAAVLRAAAARVACPALVVHGDQDAIVPPAWGAALAAALSARHVVLPGAGHCPHVTRPYAVADLVAGFVEEVRA